MAGPLAVSAALHQGTEAKSLPIVSHGSIAVGADFARGASGVVHSPSNAPPVDTDPFRRLDSLSTDRSLHVVSRSNLIEVGVDSAAYGWLEVKATVSSGSVSASIHAMDSAAAPAITAHLQGLSSYLSEHAIPVRDLTVSSGIAGQAGGNGGGGGASGEREQEAGSKSTRAPTLTAGSSVSDDQDSSMINVHA
jgi:hypothetical protein